MVNHKLSIYLILIATIEASACTLNESRTEFLHHSLNTFKLKINNFFRYML